MKCLQAMILSMSVVIFSAERMESLTLHSVTGLIPVGVILDMGSPIGKMVDQCMSMAISDFCDKHTHYATKLVLHPRDSMGDPLQALSSTIDLLENDKVEAIIGPQTSDEAEFLVNLADKAKVPIISFSATSPFLSPSNNPYFIRATTNDNSQVRAISAIVEAFRWTQLILIHEDTSYGNGLIPNLVISLENVNARVLYRYVVSPKVRNEDIVLELYKLKGMSSRVFVVHMSSMAASRFFLKVKEMGMMSERYAWITTDGIINNFYTMDSSVMESMQGVIGIRPYITYSEELSNKLPHFHHEMSVYCLWSYDAVWALAEAVEKVGIFTSKLRKNSTDKLTYLGSLLLSQTGPKLVKAISESKFKGLSGEFKLVNGEVEPVGFQIVSVIGRKVKEIGLWTVKKGISKTFNNINISEYSVSEVRWPEVSLPIRDIGGVSRKRLRIGVPVKEGFLELIKVDRPIKKNGTVVGFCVDVFKAAFDLMQIDYDFIPFANSTGQMAGTYSDLVYQVYNQNFDAAVGDITITANRSLYVDFTIPFTDFGLGMIVPIGTEISKDMWIFLEPLTTGLWITFAVFFIITGSVVWIIERDQNIEFNGPLSQQIGMIFWYSFSTLVFSQREKLMSNLSRFVVIVWIFVVLILTSCYTANLSSMLTLHQLRLLPTKGNFIGYPYGSPVQDEFFNYINYSNATFRPLQSADDYAVALKKGSKNGGVSAIIDEIPYIKLFLVKYSAHYTMVAPSYPSTNGFGFAFPKGSPLVDKISQAIAKLREDGTLYSIEQYWFQNHSALTSLTWPEIADKQNVLNIKNFGGLFLITAVSSTIALIIHYVTVFTKNNGILPTNDQEQPAGVENSTIEVPLPALDVSRTHSDRHEDHSIEEEFHSLPRENDVAYQPSL